VIAIEMSFRAPNNSLMAAMAASMMGSGMTPQAYHQMHAMGNMQPMGNTALTIAYLCPQSY
jgi:hypothetical protein